MFLTKIEVLLATGQELDPDELADKIDTAVAMHLSETRTEMIYEVRPMGTREVTLGMIDFSLEQRCPVEEVPKERSEPVTTS